MSVPVIEELRPWPHGVALGVYPDRLNPKISTEFWRAPDSSGAPNTGSAEAIGVLPPGEHVFVDLVAGAGPFWYKSRHIRPGATASPFTRWIAATPQQLTGSQLVLPPGPTRIIHVDNSTRSHTGDTATTVLQTVRVSPLAFFQSVLVKAVFGSTGTGGTKTVGVAHNGVGGWSLTLPTGDQSQTLEVLIKPSGVTTLVSTLITPAQAWPTVAVSSPVSDLREPYDVTFYVDLANSGDTASLFLSQVTYIVGPVV